MADLAPRLRAAPRPMNVAVLSFLVAFPLLVLSCGRPGVSSVLGVTNEPMTAGAGRRRAARLGQWMPLRKSVRCAAGPLTVST